MNSHSLSEDLSSVIRASEANTYRLGDFIRVSGDRAFGIVLLLLSLPSALPIPATGISTPLGIGMFLIALQMIAGRQTLWLPERVLKIKISRSIAVRMVKGLNTVLRLFEKIIRPRFEWMSRRSGHLFTGLLVASLAVVMQVPIPLTNTLPAAVIFCLALCQMEDDGLLGVIFSILAIVVIISYIAGVVAIVFFGYSSFGEIIDYLKNLML